MSFQPVGSFTCRSNPIQAAWLYSRQVCPKKIGFSSLELEVYFTTGSFHIKIQKSARSLQNKKLVDGKTGPKNM